jgi:hypothetical protein
MAADNTVSWSVQYSSYSNSDVLRVKRYHAVGKKADKMQK